MIVLGIDPGSNHTGYSVLQLEGTKATVLTYDVLHLNPKTEHFQRLKEIFDALNAVIKTYHPTVCAIEMPVYGQNAHSMLKLGRAQAAAVLAALNAGMDVFQYTPKEIKKSVTGNGNAAKEQVWYMICVQLGVTDDKGHDASDALAIALCHAIRSQSGSGTNVRSWKQFLEAHPDRIKS